MTNDIKKNRPKKILFLCGHRKSGTTLIRNLLDGHSSLAAYPNDLGILFQYFPHFILNENNENKLKLRLKKFIFENQREILFKQFDKKQKECFNLWEKEFSAKLNSFYSKDLKNLNKVIDLLSKSYSNFYLNLFPSAKPKFLIFKETLIEINAYNLYKKFEDIYFLQIVRDPRTNFLSLQKGIKDYYSKKNENLNTTLMGLIYRIKLSMNAAKHNLKLIGNQRYKVIKYEELVSNKNKVLYDILGWLDIKFEKIIEIPSLFSHEVFSNSFYNKNVKFVFNKSNQGLLEIDEKYISIIEYFLKNEMSYFNYDELMSLAKQTKYMGEFYNWSNYHYFYNDFYK